MAVQVREHRCMMLLTRLWRGLMRLTRTITMGQVAAAYVVTFVLGFLSLMVVQGAALMSEGRQTIGFQIVFWLCFAVESRHPLPRRYRRRHREACAIGDRQMTTATRTIDHGWASYP